MRRMRKYINLILSLAIISSIVTTTVYAIDSNDALRPEIGGNSKLARLAALCRRIFGFPKDLNPDEIDRLVFSIATQISDKNRGGGGENFIYWDTGDKVFGISNKDRFDNIATDQIRSLDFFRRLKKDRLLGPKTMIRLHEAQSPELIGVTLKYYMGLATEEDAQVYALAEMIWIITRYEKPVTFCVDKGEEKFGVQAGGLFVGIGEPLVQALDFYKKARGKGYSGTTMYMTSRGGGSIGEVASWLMNMIGSKSKFVYILPFKINRASLTRVNL